MVSSIVSRKPHVMHLFRNYTFMEGKESRYEGSVEAQLWEGLRASSAAPTYFTEVRILSTQINDCLMNMMDR